MKIKTGIIGGAGYTAGELIRLLINHPEVEISFVHSSSQAGIRITDLHGGLTGETDLVFSDAFSPSGIDALFLCSAHGDSRKFLDANSLPNSLKVIDLSTDFRHKATADGFVYGLPELNKPAIQTASRIANPGCFATAVQLALLPLAAAGLLKDDIHVNAITGSTGAGVKPVATTHFSWRADNISIYKPFEHQHLQEITESLLQLQPGWSSPIRFIPVRGNFTRGIFATVYTACDLSNEAIKKLYADFYRDAAFTFVAGASPDLKQVTNTNKCILHPEKIDNQLLITSVIDNLLKGASGQAIQNFNLMFGLDESLGLKLKANGF
jgi:N-acetyl-gamma-glutamyl-phosphate reductase